MPQDLFELWRRIAGPQPGLFLPSSISAQAVTVGPWFHVYTRASELAPIADVAKAYDTLIRISGSIDLVGNFALINNYLVIAPSTATTHVNLVRYLSPLRREQLDTLNRGHPVEAPNTTRVVFSRMGCLVAIKLLFMRREDWPDAAKVDSEVIGELALLTNEILKDEAQANAVSDDSLVLEFLSNWDISNTSDIALSMARADRMIRDHLRGSDSRVSSARESLGIDVSSFDGCTLEEHQALTFSTYAVMSEAVGERGAASLLQSSVADCVTFGAERVDQFFDAHSQDVDAFTNDFLPLSGESFFEAIRRPEFLMDMRSFKARPFLRLEPGRQLLLDLACVVDLSAGAMYWHLFKGVPIDRQGEVPILWGYVFEAYCRSLLDHFYPPMSGLLHHEPTYKVGREEVPVDAVVVLGSAIVVFEFKSSRLKTDDIRSRERQRIDADLEKKFIGSGRRPKGVGQLARHAQEIARGGLRRLGHSMPVHVFPVLVTEERLLESFGVNGRLNRSFRNALASDCAAMIRPLTVMSIEELEFVLPYVQNATLSWQYLLGSRFSGEAVRPFSVYQALWDARKEQGLPNLHNEYLQARWEEIFTRIVPLMKNSEPSKESPTT